MNIFNRFYGKFFHSRDKPQNALMGSMQYFFGRSAAGQTVNKRTAMQVTAVYDCVRILSDSISGLPLHNPMTIAMGDQNHRQRNL